MELLGRGYTWLDAGTHESLLEASNFVRFIESRQGIKIGCIEEIAYNLGYISKEHLINLSNKLLKNSYGKYLLKVANLQN